MASPCPTRTFTSLEMPSLARRDDAQAKLALVRNQALFGRLQANKVPALLYRAADGQVILRAGLSPLAPAVTAR